MEDERNWHLATTDEEMALTEFEFLLWRAFSSFIRWQEDCSASICEEELNGHEIAILHIIGIKGRPKSSYEVCRLLNRDDTANIRYGIKKLVKYGLIEKADSGNKKVTNYVVTPKGAKRIRDYSGARKALLVNRLTSEDVKGLVQITRQLAILRGYYDEAGRTAASYDGLPASLQEEINAT